MLYPVQVLKARPNKSPNPDALLAKMAALCSHSEQCREDIRKKLVKAGLTSIQTDDILKKLEDNNFISNKRFARAFANDKVKFSGWGRYKIRMALYQKRISDTIIREALENLDEEEYLAAAERAATAKAKNLDLSERNDLVKLYRHLASRGFESYIASKEAKLMAARQRKEKEKQN